MLVGGQAGGQRAYGRAGAAGEIGDLHRRMLLERGDGRIEHIGVARAAVERLAQRQPVGGKSAHASASSARAKISADCRQLGSPRAAACAAAIILLRSSVSPMRRPSACAKAPTSPGATSRPAPAGTVSGMAPALL